MTTIIESTLFTQDNLIITHNPHVLYSKDGLVVIQIYQSNREMPRLIRQNGKFYFNDTLLVPIQVFQNVSRVDENLLKRTCDFIIEKKAPFHTLTDAISRELFFREDDIMTMVLVLVEPEVFYKER